MIAALDKDLKELECPVCGRKLAPGSSLCQLNRHVDSCLQGIGRFLAPKPFFPAAGFPAAAGFGAAMAAGEAAAGAGAAVLGGGEEEEDEEAVPMEDLTESELIVVVR